MIYNTFYTKIKKEYHFGKISRINPAATIINTFHIEGNKFPLLYLKGKHKIKTKNFPSIRDSITIKFNETITLSK